MDRETTCQPGNVWDLFHKAWGQAKASPEYDKSVWTQLEAKILALQTGHASLEDAVKSLLYRFDHLANDAGKREAVELARKAINL